MTRSVEDTLEVRLREDTGGIRAQVSPDLRARIDAACRAAPKTRAQPARHHAPPVSWWASGFTGATAALLIIVLLDRNSGDHTETPPILPEATPTAALPERLGTLQLDVRTAELTSPLEQELQHLQADLEKARRSVERDLRAAF